MLEAIVALEKKVRSPAKKQSLRGLQNYIEERREMLNYGRAWVKDGTSDQVRRKRRAKR